MIRAQIFETVMPNQTRKITRFLIEGHAGSGEYGKDIVCSAVSALSINFVNSVEALCGTTLSYQASEGLMDVEVSDDEKTQWLAHSLRVGLMGIAEEHSKYLRVKEQLLKK